MTNSIRLVEASWRISGDTCQLSPLHLLQGHHQHLPKTRPGSCLSQILLESSQNPTFPILPVHCSKKEGIKDCMIIQTALQDCYQEVMVTTNSPIMIPTIDRDIGESIFSCISQNQAILPRGSYHQCCLWCCKTVKFVQAGFQ